MLMTMSISSAPCSTARRASYALTSGACAPEGKPITVHTLTPLPRSSSRQSGTQFGFTHTDAKQNCAASRHSVSMSARVASGLSSVWSIRLASPSDAGQ
jgi:hypothetical protein